MHFRTKYSILILAILAAGSCADSSLTPQCKDVLAPEQSSFSQVYSLFTTGEKKCSGCHSTSRPGNNYDLESKVGVYESLTTRFEIIYGQIASGNMPEDEDSWSFGELKVLESWYCNGGFYEN